MLKHKLGGSEDRHIIFKLEKRVSKLGFFGYPRSSFSCIVQVLEPIILLEILCVKEEKKSATYKKKRSPTPWLRGHLALGQAWDLSWKLYYALLLSCHDFIFWDT